MDLRQRLARLDRLTRRGGTDPRDQIPEPPTKTPPAAGAFGLREQQTAAGRLWWRQRRFPTFSPPAVLPSLAGFLPRFTAQELDPHDLLFVDTETTGLAGGTGTIPFLVGLAWWEDRSLLVRQYLLPEPADEAALLTAIGDCAARRRTLVTFNGASYDLPLLRTRALVNRLEDPFAQLAHWDLLVAGRRLWGRSCADCRQQTLETAAGGIGRPPDDIPGHLIPAVWFGFLRGEDQGAVAAVLAHNRWDLLGMVRILGEVCAWADQVDHPRPQAASDWRRAWSLGRIAAARGNWPAAADWMDAGLAFLAAGAGEWPAADQPRGFWAEAIGCAKRARAHGLVARLTEAGLRVSPRAAWLHREAAILYEHRLSRLDKALGHALSSGEDRRIGRLRRRLAAAGQSTGEQKGGPVCGL